MSTPDRDRLRILTAVVEDNPGVLSRVSGMIRRRGFNIQGLSVGPTDQAGRSRMTLTVDAGYAEVDQVEKQLDRLIEVIEIEDLTEGPKLIRQLALAKLAVTGARRQEAMARIDGFGARILDSTAEHLVVEVSGEFERVERFMEELRAYGLVELARSGPVAMSRPQPADPRPGAADGERAAASSPGAAARAASAASGG